MGTQKTSLQKTYKVNVGQDSINIEFLKANRQIDWLEILLVYEFRHTLWANIFIFR